MELFILFFLILLSGIFSGSEISLVSLNDAKLKALLDRKVKNAQTIAKLKKNPHKMIITILLGNNIVNILASVIATVWTTEQFGNEYLGYATGILTFVLLIFGEIYPKVLAQNHAVLFAQLTAHFLIIIQFIFFPIIIILEYIIKIANKSSKKNKLSKISEAKAMIGIVKESGDIEENIEKMIYNAIDFDTKCVVEIMTPKNQIISIDSKATMDELQELFIKSMKSKIVVYKKDPNNIIGIVNIKMFINSLNQKKIKQVKDIELDPPFFIDQSHQIDDLLLSFQESKQTIAIIKEDNEVLGIVTMENILEEIVGEIFDEAQKDINFITNIDKNCFDVRYDTPIYEIRKKIEDFELDEQRFKSIETLFLDRVDGEFTKDQKYYFENYLIIPIKVESNRVVKFKICTIKNEDI
ncbi:MAG: CNNM domain-containing protein [Arcobacteraceae bacterium]|nr:CNNM domain-containing protein [Arcobacteraceae bacterium]MDY0364266.1 CNNM domain-containing protein [Arcobacteraceae bacterium]